MGETKGSDTMMMRDKIAAMGVLVGLVTMAYSVALGGTLFVLCGGFLLWKLMGK